jgi:hypothetical protein
LPLRLVRPALATPARARRGRVSRSRSARSRGAGRTLRDEADHMLHVDLRGHHRAPGEHRLQEGAREPAVVPPRPRAHAAGAEKKPITPAGRRHAGDQVKHSTAFLQWLSGHGLTLSTCRQADIDAWHAEHNEHGATPSGPSCSGA